MSEGVLVSDSISGFKGFDKNLCCECFQFRIGGTFIHSDVTDANSSGFHFCENPIDVLCSYPPATSRFCKVFGGYAARCTDTTGSKVVAPKLHVVSELSLEDFVLSVDALFCPVSRSFVCDRVACVDGSSVSVVATQINPSSYAKSGASKSVSVCTKDASVSLCTGDCNVALSLSESSVSMCSGFCSTAVSQGFKSAALSVQEFSSSFSTGDESLSRSSAAFSVAVNSGDNSKSEVCSSESIAIVTGSDSKAKGVIGSWIVLTERGDDFEILDVKAVKVDGVRILPNVFYSLVHGEVVEAE